MDNTQYFYRNLIYSKQGSTVAIVDIFNPQAEPHVLDSWFGLVFQLADGQHTLEELQTHLASRYKGDPPANLKETVDSVVSRLQESKFIVLSKDKVEMPYYLSAPYEKLDIDKAKNLLKKDRPDIESEISGI